MAIRINGRTSVNNKTSTYSLEMNSSESEFEKYKNTTDADVGKALDEYMCAINRYNNADLSDPRMENVYFLERQVAYIGLQLALAKARIRGGMDPSLDYTCFENLLKFVGGCGQ